MANILLFAIGTAMAQPIDKYCGAPESYIEAFGSTFYVISQLASEQGSTLSAVGSATLRFSNSQDCDEDSVNLDSSCINIEQAEYNEAQARNALERDIARYPSRVNALAWATSDTPDPESNLPSVSGFLYIPGYPILEINDGLVQSCYEL